MAKWRQRRRRGSSAETTPEPDPAGPTDPADDVETVTTDESADSAPGATRILVEDPETEPAGPDDDVEPPRRTPAAQAAAQVRSWFRPSVPVRETAPVTLLLAAHPRQALLTAVGVAIGAAAAGRPARETAVVFLTVLVGQTILGWHNDIVDRERDARHDTPRKPVADGRLDTGTVWYAIVIGVLLLIPLSISTGITAGALYLGSLVVGLLGNIMLRAGVLSWLTWAASYALLPYYLSYGGWGGDAVGDPPQPLMVVLAALLGVGVHLVRSIWGLVADDADGWTYLPLRLGRRLGASRLLVVSASYTAVVLVAIVVAGATVGLRA